MGVYLATQAILDPGDEIIVLEPYYGPYAAIIKLTGATMVPAPLAAGSQTVDLDAIKQRITPRTKRSS